MSLFIREKSTHLKVLKELLHIHGLRPGSRVSCFLSFLLSLLCHRANKGTEANRSDVTSKMAGKSWANSRGLQTSSLIFFICDSFRDMIGSIASFTFKTALVKSSPKREMRKGKNVDE